MTFKFKFFFEISPCLFVGCIFCCKLILDLHFVIIIIIKIKIAIKMEIPVIIIAERSPFDIPLDFFFDNHHCLYIRIYLILYNPS